MNTAIKPNKLTVTLLCALLGACGFHLRGTVDLPAGVEPIAIQNEAVEALLVSELRSVLSVSGVELAATGESANYRLVIGQQDQDRRTAALDQNARAVEYQLIESITFELRDKEGKTVLGPNTLTERRIMPNDPNRVVSSDEEEQLLRREMQQNLAAKIARQLSSFKGSNTPPTDVQP